MIDKKLLSILYKKLTHNLKDKDNQPNSKMGWEYINRQSTEKQV